MEGTISACVPWFLLDILGMAVQIPRFLESPFPLIYARLYLQATPCLMAGIADACEAFIQGGKP